jgi:Mg2+-importing ATPase
MAKSQVIVKHLSAMQNFGSIDVLCSDKTGTLTSGEMQLQDSLDPFGAPSAETLRLGYLSSFFESGIRSPLDFAILRTGKKDLLAKRKIDEIPFDFERRRLSVVVTEGESSLLVTKGAPESVLPLCSRFRKGKEIAPFREEDAARAEETHRRFADAGTRVLAVAWREVSEKEYPFAKDDERDLVLEGFLTFLDPPLPGLPELMRGLRRDGIRIKVLTGDNELVARHVCADLGFSSVAVVSGQEIERMTDAALAHVVEENDIFARVSPAHKNRIILALKGRRHVVGFLGDGINDAPSLHAADVGISFSSAVDVAREAADIILLRRDLKVLHEGILEGRRAFGNVVKYLLMGTSSNFGNMLSMALASAFLPFLPMLPLQILLNNFLYDLAQITIPTDQVDPSFMHKPRHWDISLVRDFMVIVGPLSSVYDFLTFFALLRIFHFTNALFRTGWFLESLVTQTLVIFIIRTGGGPFASHSSRPLRITVLTVVTVGVLLPYAPFATELGFAPLPLAFFPFLFAVTATYLVFVELVKRRVLRRIYV